MKKIIKNIIKVLIFWVRVSFNLANNNKDKICILIKMIKITNKVKQLLICWNLIRFSTFKIQIMIFLKTYKEF